MQVLWKTWPTMIAAVIPTALIRVSTTISSRGTRRRGLGHVCGSGTARGRGGRAGFGGRLWPAGTWRARRGRDRPEGLSSAWRTTSARYWP
ncbi:MULTISPECIES: hypothetical protein [Amycolatopsis]|uniref:Secreted protein n=1 Tax=Amycolatopsis plumensis TaxID=236508 RepID=A0ABV5U3L8_9PSEU